MRKILKSVKKNGVSLVCVLLAAAVFVTGGISYSQYISSDPLSGKTSAGSFTCVASIDGVSALSFTNTAFWGGSVEDDRIAMNALRTLEFTVSNHETVNGVQQVNQVKTGYTLSFSTPQNFGEKLALQLFDEEAKAIMPQIVIEDILATQDGGIYDTAASEDYHADSFADMRFVVKRSGAGAAETITARCEDHGITVILEPYEREVKQTLLFRLWDCSALTSQSNPTMSNEGGTLCPPMQITYTSVVSYYRIMISHPDFTMGAGTEQTHKYSIRIAPTAEIVDQHLGGKLILNDEGKLEIDGADSSHRIAANYETVTDTYADGRIETTAGRVIGSYTIYNTGETITTAPTTVTTVREISDVTTSTDTAESTTASPADEQLTGSHDSDDDGVEVEGTSSWVTYYKHTQQVEQTRTTTTVQTETTVETFTTRTEQAETVYTISTHSVTDTADGTIIEQDVTEVRNANSYSDIMTVTTTKTITTTKTEKYSGTRTYYTYTSGWDSTHTYTSTSTYPDSIIWNDKPDSAVTSDPTENVTTQTDTSTDTAEPQTTSTTFSRRLTRYSGTTEIQIGSITYTLDDEDQILDEAGDVFPLFETVEYADGSWGSEQKYYLSQCYSKNYPLMVNVIFEQLQN